MTPKEKIQLFDIEGRLVRTPAPISCVTPDICIYGTSDKNFNF